MGKWCLHMDAVSARYWWCDRKQSIYSSYLDGGETEGDAETERIQPEETKPVLHFDKMHYNMLSDKRHICAHYTAVLIPNPNTCVLKSLKLPVYLITKHKAIKGEKTLKYWLFYKIYTDKAFYFTLPCNVTNKCKSFFFYQ